MRTAKVYVDKAEIRDFPVTEMRVDPYYQDLYNPSNYRRNGVSCRTNNY